MLAGYVGAPRDSRVLVLSRRELSRQTWHASQYEFEDLVLELDDAVLLAPPALAHPSLRSMAGEAANVAARGVRARRRHPGFPSPSMTPTRVTTDHDLLLAVFHHPEELAYLHRLQGWRERARTAVCVLIELWEPWVERDADYLSLLRSFDRVYLFNPSVAPAVARRLGVPEPDYLPMAVDALRASPLPHAPARVLDVYSYGRRSPGVHAALLELVEREGLTYVYDTLGNASVRDPAEHRRLIANMVKRSGCFLAHSINDSLDRHDRTGGVDDALAARYFEGMAGGAVLLGSRPSSALFDAAFPWPDAVVPLSYDGSETEQVLDELRREPERVARIRAENVAGCLRRHDWAHRWSTILADAGLAAPAALAERLARLTAQAASVEGGALAAVP